MPFLIKEEGKGLEHAQLEAVGLGIAGKSLHLPSQHRGHPQIPAPWLSRPCSPAPVTPPSQLIPYNSPKKYMLSKFWISVFRGLWGRSLHHWVPPPSTASSRQGDFAGLVSQGAYPKC